MARSRGRTVVAVEGERELRRRLRRVEGGLAELKAAHKEVATSVANWSRPRTPRRTGRLAATARASGTNTASIVRYGNARVPYAAPIHYGWPARHIAPQEWLIRTAQQTERTWVAMYNQHVRRLVERTSTQ